MAVLRSTPAILIGVLVAIVSALAGSIYLADLAQSLPAFFPGHSDGSNSRYVPIGLALLALAPIVLGTLLRANNGKGD